MIAVNERPARGTSSGDTCAECGRDGRFYVDPEDGLRKWKTCNEPADYWVDVAVRRAVAELVADGLIQQDGDTLRPAHGENSISPEFVNRNGQNALFGIVGQGFRSDRFI